MLEQAEKEVKSIEAKREIVIARSGIRTLRAALKQADIDDEVIRDAIRLADRCDKIELSEQLQAMLDVDFSDDQDYRVELTKDGMWKASVSIRGEVYKLGNYSDPQLAVDVVEEFKAGFKVDGE